ncbi:MAG: amino acid permease [Phycisphaerae bacterium]|nr:amino acid permease [Phycisphaerae bacterium]
MAETGTQQQRHLGLFGATGIGVGAIVGGGILALAGVAFTATGAAAWLAFLLNGGIAIVTALSFAELSSAFPQSGGTYLYAKRVLSVGAAFSVGWVVWFASIVAAALYAVGFSTFLLDALRGLIPIPREGLAFTVVLVGVALLATLVCTWMLCGASRGGANWMNILKLVVFAVLIMAGLHAWFRQGTVSIQRLTTPVLPYGFKGLVTAMGFTFIALQGFDLIAAVAGEVKSPRHTLPRAMILSLLIALAVYVPLMILIAVAGVPEGRQLNEWTAEARDLVVVQAARVFMGEIGFWLVILVGIVSMLSALIANLYAASRIARAMAQDRTLPRFMDQLSVRTGMPIKALWCTGGTACLVLLVVQDVGRAGAAASLIFLITFALTQLICILARIRKPNHQGYKLPFWPVLPGLGVVACSALAIFQGMTVPAAGLITGAWLVAGFFCYLWVFGQRARVYDAASESFDPDLLELRGRSPLVLVPIANPANAGTMALLAACIAPPRVGRILLLNVARMPGLEDPDDESDLQVTADVIQKSMSAAMRERIRAEGLATLARDPWMEIDRVARTHRCASVLLGMASLQDDAIRERLEGLVSRLPGNVMILRAPQKWSPRAVQRVLVPIGGRVGHNALRARLLYGLQRRVDVQEGLDIHYLMVMPTSTSAHEVARVKRLWESLITDETQARFQVDTVPSDDVAQAIVDASSNMDLLVLGLNKSDPKKRVFGRLTTQVVQQVRCAVVVIGQRG